MMQHSFEDIAGICHLTNSGKMLTHALLSFLFFIHGFIQIRFDLFKFFLFLFYEQEVLISLDRKVERKVSHVYFIFKNIQFLEATFISFFILFFHFYSKPVLLFSLFITELKGLFGVQLNVCDKGFIAKIVKGFYTLTIFAERLGAVRTEGRRRILEKNGERRTGGGESCQVRTFTF